MPTWRMSDVPLSPNWSWPTLLRTVPPPPRHDVLVFAILAWVLGCVIFSIVAWAMGSGDLKEIDAGRMDPEGRGLTQAGKIIGMIHVIVTIAAVALVGLILFVVLILGGFAAASAASGAGGP